MMHRLDAIGDRELREILLFARAQPLPVTADEVAAARRIHRNVARGRLERLAEAGFLVRSFERRTGRRGPGAGRPAKTYRVFPDPSGPISRYKGSPESGAFPPDPAKFGALARAALASAISAASACTRPG